MLLKISLGLAILAGLATLYFTSMPLKDKINGLNETIASETSAKEAALADKTKLAGELKTTKASLETTAGALKESTNALAFATARMTEQEKRADKASKELLAVTEDRNEKAQELNKWTTIGIPPEKVREELELRKKLQAERDTLVDEQKILVRNNKKLAADIKRIVGDTEMDVELPTGTKGKVVAVDPKYDFVVLNIGGNQGLLENGKLLVNRDGKLIAKVKITHVEPTRAIANIMPEWKQEDVMEGDQVIY